MIEGQRTIDIIGSATTSVWHTARFLVYEANTFFLFLDFQIFKLEPQLSQSALFLRLSRHGALALLHVCFGFRCWKKIWACHYKLYPSYRSQRCFLALNATKHLSYYIRLYACFIFRCSRPTRADPAKRNWKSWACAEPRLYLKNLAVVLHGIYGQEALKVAAAMYWQALRKHSQIVLE